MADPARSYVLPTISRSRRRPPAALLGTRGKQNPARQVAVGLARRSPVPLVIVYCGQVRRLLPGAA
jgi:hypothetical protein